MFHDCLWLILTSLQLMLEVRRMLMMLFEAVLKAAESCALLSGRGLGAGRFLGERPLFVPLKST